MALLSSIQDRWVQILSRRDRYVAHLHGCSQSLPLNAISNTLVSNYPILLMKITIFLDVIDISEMSAASRPRS